MSGRTMGNILKITVALIIFIFMPVLVLMVGIGRKNRKVITEGAIYVALFLAAFSTPEDSPLYTLASFVGVGVIGVSAIRLYMLRDLWLRGKGEDPRHNVPTQPDAATSPVHRPSPAGASAASPTEDLSRDLAWVASLAKQNKDRLPVDAYISILETCQTLDGVIDAETRQPVGDASFEYELTATVREFLPAVIRNYLAIPPSMLDNRQPSGRTPNEELAEQLQLLSGQAETLHTSRHRHTSAELTNTGNFLRERFGHRQGGGYDFGIR